VIRSTRRVPAILLAAVSAAALVGCATFKYTGFERPHVQLESVSVTGLGLSGGSLRLELDVYNPNEYAVRGSAFTGRLKLEDTQFGEILFERGFELAPQAHTTLEVPMQFTWEGVGAAARGLLARGSVSYELGGALFVDTPGGDKRVEIDTGGVVAVRDMIGLE
jgi:LEA14-like dessication related protein